MYVYGLSNILGVRKHGGRDKRMSFSRNMHIIRLKSVLQQPTADKILLGMFIAYMQHHVEAESFEKVHDQLECFHLSFQRSSDCDCIKVLKKQRG